MTHSLIAGSGGWEWGSDPNVVAPSAPAYRRHQAEQQTNAFSGLLAAYDGAPEPVDFRSLIGPLPADELTHGLYPYPARMLRHIPRFLLGCAQILPQGDSRILDPFCGSGTILLESLGWGHRAIGLDTNPMAALLSAVKTTPIVEGDVVTLAADVIHAARTLDAPSDLPSFMYRWYGALAGDVVSRLATAVRAYQGETQSPEWQVLRLHLAIVADRLSVRDPRVPVPVRAARPADMTSNMAWDIVESSLKRIVAAVSQLPSYYAGRSSIHAADARMNETYRTFAQVDLVMTSPPYGAAQKYVRSTSLGLGALGLSGPKGTADVGRLQVGRERISDLEARAWPVTAQSDASTAVLQSVYAASPERAAIFAHYLADMNAALDACLAKLRIGGHFILVAGTNTVAGIHVDTHALLAAHLQARGLTCRWAGRDKIKGRQLLTKRRGGRPMTEEFVYVYLNHGC